MKAPVIINTASQNDIARSAKQRLQAELSLRVSGQNIWVGLGDKLTHYDWDSGKVLREITLPESGGELVEHGDELLMIGAQSVTHISLASGDSRVEAFGATGRRQHWPPRKIPPPADCRARVRDNGQPLDPQKVEAQAQNLKTARADRFARIARQRPARAATGGRAQG